jgi:hypothetical protein
MAISMRNGAPPQLGPDASAPRVTPPEVLRSYAVQARLAQHRGPGPDSLPPPAAFEGLHAPAEKGSNGDGEEEAPAREEPPPHQRHERERHPPPRRR